jgi:hypothetical protein
LIHGARAALPTLLESPTHADRRSRSGQQAGARCHVGDEIFLISAALVLKKAHRSQGDADLHLCRGLGYVDASWSGYPDYLRTASILRCKAALGMKWMWHHLPVFSRRASDVLPLINIKPIFWRILLYIVRATLWDM